MDMSITRKLMGITAALSMASLLSVAVTAQESEPPRESGQTAEAPADAPAAPPATSSPQNEPAGAATGETSPFEYEATEQISEDLSVSFPVDI